MAFRHEIKDWKKISLDTAKLLLDQSEKILKDTISALDRNTDNSLKYLVIMIGANSSIITYLFSKGLCSYLNQSLLIFSIPLTISCLLLIRNLFMKPVAAIGYSPKKIMKDKLASANFKDNEQTVSLILSICEKTQDKIDHNQIQNGKIRTRMTNALRIVLISLVISPFIPFLLGLLLELLNLVQ